MTHRITRRRFIQGTAAGGLAAAGLTMGAPFMREAHAAEKLSVVDWGPPWIDNTKSIAERWGKADITWTLHSGGAASILPKIKAAWPNPPYDIVDIWSPVFESMMREGWAATVTHDDVPNLKDIPDSLISKDDQGNIKNIPRGVSGIFFTYRNDICPIEIKSVEDLLSPKLKGQILWPNPTLNTNLQVVALAMARGGDERNIDPGWNFLKELAEAGNIGRVSANTSDVINSLTTGETSVTFVDAGTLSGAKGIPMTHLTKTNEDLKSFLFVSGWMVLESSENKKLAFDFANHTITKENNESYYEAVGEVPANSTSTHAIDHLKFSDDELKKFAVIPDWDYVSAQVDAWNKRFEKDIATLL